MGFDYPHTPLAGPVLMAVFSMLLSPLIGWMREKGKSVFDASTFHSAMNAVAGLSFCS